jgi:hypothetical protein
MEPLERLRAKIADFPGYDSDVDRRRSDQYVRSYLGEALTELAQRTNLTPEQQQRIDDLLLQVGFADQRDFARNQILTGKDGLEKESAVATTDAATVLLADRAIIVDRGSLDGYLDEVTITLESREAAMRAALKTT